MSRPPRPAPAITTLGRSSEPDDIFFSNGGCGLGDGVGIEKTKLKVRREGQEERNK